jgi:hypothetical protein
MVKRTGRTGHFQPCTNVPLKVPIKNIHANKKSTQDEKLLKSSQTSLKHKFHRGEVTSEIKNGPSIQFHNLANKG